MCAKPNPNAKLLNLPEEQQAKLAEWLLSGMPYHAARELLAKEFHVSVGLSAFSGFWSQVCQPELLRRRSQAVQTADAVATEAASKPGRFDQATIDQLKQRAFELSISPVANPKDVKALFMLVLKARDQDLTERRIVILENKAKQADDAESALKDESLSPDQRQLRLRQIFGMS